MASWGGRERGWAIIDSSEACAHLLPVTYLIYLNARLKKPQASDDWILASTGILKRPDFPEVRSVCMGANRFLKLRGGLNKICAERNFFKTPPVHFKAPPQF